MKIDGFSSRCPSSTFAREVAIKTPFADAFHHAAGLQIQSSVFFDVYSPLFCQSIRVRLLFNSCRFAVHHETSSASLNVAHAVDKFYWIDYSRKMTRLIAIILPGDTTVCSACVRSVTH